VDWLLGLDEAKLSGNVAAVAAAELRRAAAALILKSIFGYTRYTLKIRQEIIVE
jgi:hypothetical protein